MIGALFAILFPFAFFFLVYVIMARVTETDAFWYMRERVWLQDYTGEWFKSRIHTDKNGVEWAPVYAITLSGHVVLNPNGEATGESSHIKFWSREKPPKAEGKIELRNKQYAKKY